MITDAIRNTLKDRLLAEKTSLESEFAKHGKIVGVLPNGQDDWAVTPSEPDDSEQDFTVMADRVEEFENNQSTFALLELRYRDVCDALAKMEAGTYGLCESSGEPIELDRLEANPSARTCKLHM